MPRRKVRSVRFRWLAAIVIMCILPGWAAWHFVSGVWKIRTAATMMNMGSISEVQDALRQLEQIAATSSQPSPELLYLMGRAYRRTGAVDSGLKYLQLAEAAGWDVELIQQQRKLALFQSGHIEDSGGELNRLLRQNAADDFAYEVYEALAKGYLSTYRFTDAIHCLDFWSEWCSEATDPRMWRANVWEQTERWEKATEEYRHVLKINPSHLEARQSLGRILLLQLNQTEAAQIEFERCLKQSPQDFNSHLGLATSERYLARPESAEKRLRGLLNWKLTPQQFSSAMMELGQILLDRRMLTEAISTLTEVVKADPLNSAAHYSLGTAYAANGDPEKAASFFERSRVLGEQFNRLTTITSELVNHPENADLRWEAGRILTEHGMSAEGAAWMATALIYDPDHKATHESLAEYYENVSPDERLARNHRDKFNSLK